MSDFDAHTNSEEPDGLAPEGNRDWVPDEAMKALVAERDVHPDETPEQTARRLLIENLGPVTLGLIHTALHGSTERTRLDAQKYVMERVLGRVGDDAYGAVDSPIESFLRGVENIANNRPVGG